MTSLYDLPHNSPITLSGELSDLVGLTNTQNERHMRGTLHAETEDVFVEFPTTTYALFGDLLSEQGTVTLTGFVDRLERTPLLSVREVRRDH